jgi:hypothetical protein
MVAGIGVALLLASALALPTSAGGRKAAAFQGSGFQTPTPGPDGKIIYVVQKDDTLWTIAALSGLTVEQLRGLNGLGANDILSPGTRLVLGLAGPVPPTANPLATPSPSPAPVTPTPAFGTGQICALLFVDSNGNARLDAGEPPLANGRISVADASGHVAGEFTTKVEFDSNSDPLSHCFQDLPTGDYNVSAAAPADYNPTTAMSVPVHVDPGDIKYVEFAAQASGEVGAGTSGGGGGSTLLGLLGLLLLGGAVGIGLYAARMGRRSPNSLRR